MIKQIAKQQLPELNAREDVEFIDWYEVEAFPADVTSFIEMRLDAQPTT